MGLSALISKIFLFVTIIINILTQVLVLLLWWPVPVTVVSKRGLHYVDSSSRNETLSSRATKTTIGFSIILFFLVVPTRSLGGFKILGTIGRKSLCFLKLKVEEIEVFIVGVLFELRSRRAMAPGVVNIYLTDQGKKVEGGFGLRNDSFPDGLVPSVFPTAVLLVLRTNEEPLRNKRIKTGSEVTVLASNLQKTV